MFKSLQNTPVEWLVTKDQVDYPDAVSVMEQRVERIQSGEAAELVWLLEHPPLYTAGTSAKKTDLLQPDRFPVHTTGRGGQYTYHGPGQRVAYVMLDLKQRRRDVRLFVTALEAWITNTLKTLDIRSHTYSGRVGVWVASDSGARRSEEKIAAIGVRLRKWVSFHGVSINVRPNLEHFSGIVPCGLSGYGVTSLEKLGKALPQERFDELLQAEFEKVFGATVDAEIELPRFGQLTQTP